MRLISRPAWSEEADTANLLSRQLDRRVSNPLIESSRREIDNARFGFTRLEQRMSAQVAMQLRLIYETQIRNALKLKNRAIMKDDYLSYLEYRKREDALAVIRHWLDEKNQPSLSCERLLDACNRLSPLERFLAPADCDKLKSRLEGMEPNDIPAGCLSELGRILDKLGAVINKQTRVATR